MYIDQTDFHPAIEAELRLRAVPFEQRDLIVITESALAPFRREP
jgi:hypothetical protein